MMLTNGHPQSIAEALDTKFQRLSQAAYVTDQTSDVEVVVDLAAIEKVSSEELNGLIRFHAKVRQQGRTLVLENVQETLFHIFNVTRLDRLFAIRNTIST